MVNRTGIDEEVARLIVKIANNIRSLSKKQEISTSISIRETLMISELVSDGWSVKSAMEWYIFQSMKELIWKEKEVQYIKQYYLINRL